MFTNKDYSKFDQIDEARKRKSSHRLTAMFQAILLMQQQASNGYVYASPLGTCTRIGYGN